MSRQLTISAANLALRVDLWRKSLLAGVNEHNKPSLSYLDCAIHRFAQWPIYFRQGMTRPLNISDNCTVMFD